MIYEFPHIVTIDQVKHAIKDKPEFVVSEQEHFDIINYVVAGENTFPAINSYEDTILRECRGLVFDKYGWLVSRRYHKFFNLNERLETLINNVDFSQPHMIMEKLDGSMITPLIVGDKVRWATKMGFSDVALMCEKFVEGKEHYERFARDNAKKGYTPIFEYVGRRNRIVVDYPEENLILTGVRHNTSGEYIPYHGMRITAESYGIPVIYAVPHYHYENIDQLVEKAKGLIDGEGYIIRFDNGMMLKVKSEWYVAIHKAKDNLLFEKSILRMVLEDKVDDVKPFLMKDEAERLEAYYNDVWQGVLNESLSIGNKLHWLQKEHGDNRKAFAIDVNTNVKDKFWKRILFKMFETPDYMASGPIVDELIKLILEHTKTQTEVDSVRHLFNAKWEL